MRLVIRKKIRIQKTNDKKKGIFGEVFLSYVFEDIICNSWKEFYIYREPSRRPLSSPLLESVELVQQMLVSAAAYGSSTPLNSIRF